MQKSKQFIKQHGQAVVFFAIMLPVLMLFVFAVLNLGWLYLNKSRLQNAAEAAAIAGANKFGYFMENELPEGFKVNLIYDLDDAADNFKKYETAEMTAKELNRAIRIDTQSIAALNLNGEDARMAVGEIINEDLTKIAFSVTDAWTNEIAHGTGNLLVKPSDGDSFYYKVRLTENVNHIFKILDGIFNTQIPAEAVAKITKVQLSGKDVYSQMLMLEGKMAPVKSDGTSEQYTRSSIAPNWEIQKKYQSDHDTYKTNFNQDFYTGNWNHYQDAQVHYKTGDNYRTENIIINYENSIATEANGYNKYQASELDSINADFKADLKYDFNKISTVVDTDISDNLTDADGGITPTNNSGWTQSQMNLRIHSTINFTENYETRKPLPDSVKNDYEYRFKEEKDTESDPLYVRIESEPMISNLGFQRQPALNTVRQIIININKSNIDGSDNRKIHSYKYRPLVIFYDGPERINADTQKRDPQPVILNLNADFRGILFAPNSPVVINGNGHKFEGFVIAKEFTELQKEMSYPKFKYEADGTEYYFKDVDGSTLTGNTSEYLLVSKDGNSFFKIDRADFMNSADLDEFKKTHSNIILHNADEYDLTTYYRQKGTEPRTEAYVRKGLKLGDANDKTVDIIEGTLTNWYEVKRASDGKTFSIRNTNDNFLFAKDGWRIACDADGNPKYIFKKSDVTELLAAYDEVKDVDGKFAYILKSKNLLDAKTQPVYRKLVNDNGEVRYFNKDTADDYYLKSTLKYTTKDAGTDKTETVKDDRGNAIKIIMDKFGNVQYTDKLTPTYNYKYPDKYPKGFEVKNFKLVSPSFYNRCGAIPKRGVYKKLDAFETDGDYWQDMFFETERAKFIR